MTDVTISKQREGDVLLQLDVSQKRLRALRRALLSEAQHYGRDAAGIWYTPEALELMRAHLASGTAEALPLSEIDEDSPGEAEAPEEALRPGDREDLTITRVFPKRDRAVLCLRANGLEVMCQVQSTKNLISGMVLRSCHLGEYQRWYYNGPLPRSRRGGRCLGFFPPR